MRSLPTSSRAARLQCRPLPTNVPTVPPPSAPPMLLVSLPKTTLGNQASMTFPTNSTPLPTNQVESPTQPTTYSIISSTDFIQMIAHASGLTCYCYQLIAATTTLGVARVIRACLPIRCDSSHRVLPTPGDAIPSNGIPPRPPPGQYRRHLPTPHSTQPPPPPATPHSDSLESSPTPSINIFPPVRSVASAADRAFGGTVG